MINSKILKRKFTVDTSLHHLYQMNQKAFKKQLTISSKDETWQGFLGATVPNRNDDLSRLDQTDTKKEEKISKKDKEKKEKDDGKGSWTEAAEKVKASKNDSQAKGGDKSG